MPERETTPTLPGRWMWPGMMPIFACPGVMMPGQFGPISRAFGCRQEGLDAQHVGDRDPLGDRDDELDAGVGRLHDRVGRERRRHEDHRSVGAGRRARLLDRIEDRNPLDRLAALARA